MCPCSVREEATPPPWSFANRCSAAPAMSTPQTARCRDSRNTRSTLRPQSGTSTDRGSIGAFDRPGRRSSKWVMRFAFGSSSVKESPPDLHSCCQYPISSAVMRSCESEGTERRRRCHTLVDPDAGSAHRFLARIRCIGSLQPTAQGSEILKIIITRRRDGHSLKGYGDPSGKADCLLRFASPCYR